MDSMSQFSKSNIIYPKQNQVDKKSTKFRKINSISLKHMIFQYSVKFRFFYPNSGASSHFEYLKEVIFKLKVNKIS